MELKKTLVSIPQMDCGAEAQMVRAAVDKIDGFKGLEVDLDDRQVTLYHDGASAAFMKPLEGLGFGATLISSDLIAAEGLPDAARDEKTERRTLKWVLGINTAMFVAEVGVGLYAGSTGLIADSLDMLADAFVYGISLYAVGKAAARRISAASAGGYCQMALAGLVVFDVIRRFIYGSDPDFAVMIGMACVALTANATSLWLLRQHRKGGVHMRASIIFTNNDVLANVGVILAGGFVYWTGSNIPDLVIGLIITAFVFKGSLDILGMARRESGQTH
jgi:Co/Zn/Cd efflux system component/copper chaperone CopZ